MTLPLHQLEFAADGQAASHSQLGDFIAAGKSAGATDLIFLAHGFRCDAADATALFTRLLENMSPNLADVSGRRFAVAGVYWPSQKYPESAPDAVLNGRNARDRFVASVLAGLGDGSDDPTEGLPLLYEIRGSDLLEALGTHGENPEGGIVSIQQSVASGIDRFLNFTSWYAMKKLSGEVGANGLAAAVLAARQELGNIRIHLVGHSLGGRLVTACCKTLAQQCAAPIDSLSLLEGAFSHFGFSPDAGSGQPGFFRQVIEHRIVRGPIVSTFSKQDSVVGTAYAIASRLSRDSLQAFGNAADPYGGIGHNGAQRTPESTVAPLHQAGQPYRFPSGIVTCLDGSSGPGSAGLITAHGDITNPHVTYAVSSAIRTAE
jgi:pimeloyl-ACP methyl ester carboxylesterase